MGPRDTGCGGDREARDDNRPPFTVAVAGYTDDPSLLRDLAASGVDVFFLAPAKLIRRSQPERRDAIAAYAERVLAHL